MESPSARARDSAPADASPGSRQRSTTEDGGAGAWGLPPSGPRAPSAGGLGVSPIETGLGRGFRGSPTEARAAVPGMVGVLAVGGEGSTPAASLHRPGTAVTCSGYAN